VLAKISRLVNGSGAPAPVWTEASTSSGFLATCRQAFAKTMPGPHYGTAASDPLGIPRPTFQARLIVLNSRLSSASTQMYDPPGQLQG
jgi:hypothetical protein